MSISENQDSIFTSRLPRRPLLALISFIFNITLLFKYFVIYGLRTDSSVHICFSDFELVSPAINIFVDSTYFIIYLPSKVIQNVIKIQIKVLFMVAIANGSIHGDEE